MKFEGIEELLNEFQEKMVNEGIGVKIRKSEWEVADETIKTFHNCIEEEYNSQIINRHNYSYHPKNNYFHSVFKLENGMIIDGLMIVHPKKDGIMLEVKHREILA